MLPRIRLYVRSQQICKATLGLRALVMTLNESWESMHAEEALPAINKPQAYKPFPLLSIYLYLLCPEGTWGVLEEH